MHGHRATHVCIDHHVSSRWAQADAGVLSIQVKGLGYVRGTFTVKDDLPEHLRHGLFKE